VELAVALLRILFERRSVGSLAGLLSAAPCGRRRLVDRHNGPEPVTATLLRPPDFLYDRLPCFSCPMFEMLKR
jgi:hypothetical protein